jgi:hypothetical protein
MRCYITASLSYSSELVNILLARLLTAQSSLHPCALLTSISAAQTPQACCRHAGINPWHALVQLTAADCTGEMASFIGEAMPRTPSNQVYLAVCVASR